MFSTVPPSFPLAKKALVQGKDVRSYFARIFGLKRSVRKEIPGKALSFGRGKKVRLEAG